MNRTGVLLSGRYQLMEEIGSGGMADVYKASDIKLNRYVAVKVLKEEFSEDENFVLKFQHEAMAAASIQNPNVVNVYDVGEDGDINYIVMEIADGITLKEYIKSKGKLEIIETINIAMQIVNGIKAAHAHNIIHRDIKPQNVMVTADGKAKVMDFGIAKAVTAQTITANTVGSVHYISPEQARGSACDERCDIYSIGITMYEMITGRVPFDGESTVAVALAHIKEPIVPPSNYEPMIPVSLEKIVMKCTQKKPEMRYASAEELLDDLKKALMTPDGDFVKEVVVPEMGGTRVFTEQDSKLINENSDKVPATEITLKSQEEEDYQLGIEESDDGDGSDEEEKDGRMEKVVLAIGIVALIGVILIAGVLIGKAFHIFNKTPSIETSTEATSQSDSESDMVPFPEVSGASREEGEKLLADAGFIVNVELTSSEVVEIDHIVSVTDSAGKVLHTGDLINAGENIVMYVSSGKDTVLIADTIIGMSEKAAEKTLTRQGLEVEIEHELSDTVNQGLVIRCEPGAGEPVPVGSKVVLYVSDGSGKDMVTVPDLVDKTVTIAKTMLEAANLVSDPKFEYSADYPLNTVIRQEIEAGSSVEAHTTIVYYVSLGIKQVSVPKLSGTLEEVEELLKKAGLVVGKVSKEYSDTVAEGQVIAQNVAAGTMVDSGSSVDILVSLGKKTTYSEVPPIVGKTEAEALEALSDRNLRGHKAGEEASSMPKGTVIRISPEAGSQVEEKTTIDYILSLGDE